MRANKQVAPILKRTYKINNKSDLDARPLSLFTFISLLFICTDAVLFIFAFRLLCPQVTSRLCSRTHGKGCVAFWQQGWSRCRGFGCGRRPWQHSERSGWWLLLLWRSSSLCSAGVEEAGGPACWGTSLPSEPSHQTSVGGIYCGFSMCHVFIKKHRLSTKTEKL